MPKHFRTTPPRAKASAQCNQRGEADDLYNSQQWLRMLLDSAEDYAIFAINCQGKIATWNKGSERIFGYTEEEALDQDFAIIFTPEDRASGAPQREAERALREGYSPDERWHLRKDGTRLFISGCVRPLQDEAENVHGFLKVAHDITRSRRVEQALRESEERFRLLADSSPTLIWITDADGQLLFSNRRLLETFGKKLEQMHHLDWHEVVHPEDFPAYDKAFREALAQRKPFRIEIRLRRADGQWRWFDSQVVPRFSDSGEYLGMAGNGSDTTEIRQARDELARLNEDLEQRVQERTARLTETIQELEGFSYSLSHDMRAPLRAMRSFAEILRTEFSQLLGAEGADMLERIANSAARLDQLIQEVLTLSRLRTERVETKPVDLEKLLQQIIGERSAFQPSRADIEIVTPLPKVLGHDASLSQCLSNLLDNAIKFVAPEVRPRVRIRAELRNGLVRLWVEDNGIGISKRHQKRIFGMFQRLHSIEEYPGTGIGLTIVRKAAARMGGQVGVESEHGQGSRFWLELPSP